MAFSCPMSPFCYLWTDPEQPSTVYKNGSRGLLAVGIFCFGRPAPCTLMHIDIRSMTGTFLGDYNYERLRRGNLSRGNLDGEMEYELCTLTNFIGDLHMALVGLHNGFDQAETKSKSTLRAAFIPTVQ